MEAKTNTKPSSLRWAILRQALLRKTRESLDNQSPSAIKSISRKTHQGFNLIPGQGVEDHVNEESNFRDVCMCYTLPVDGSPKIFVKQRVNNGADLSDFEVSDRYNVDNTGLVCQWPSEDVLAYFCLSHADMFRSKRVIELGSGYGLAGLVIAATTEASEVVISDGNPVVVDYIQHSIEDNSKAFGNTKVKALALHWDEEVTYNISNTFDVIVASDCTFFKEFHNALACTVKLLLKNDGHSEAIFFCPKRGDSLDKFLEKIEENGLHFSITENYDSEVWKRHQGFMTGDDTCPSYDKHHCYPLMVRITL
ncbi:CALMODULIN-LYSINE N-METHYLTRANSFERASE [Salix viminalis]|uniref:Calmodulin-lysine N-methyltransferase n=1 Tax=Salix viminalis TaxID=40686 RepID=A0A9Q0NYL1_SALVM|nr:CALMODULIN-LYSINE N-METHYLTRANSFERASE [Salix viminalis]